MAKGNLVGLECIVCPKSRIRTANCRREFFVLSDRLLASGLTNETLTTPGRHRRASARIQPHLRPTAVGTYQSKPLTSTSKSVDLGV